MIGRVRIEQKNRENMGVDEELEMLLGEIPHATSLNLHHHPQSNGHGSFVTQTINGMMYGMYDGDPSSHYKYTYAPYVSGFSVQSDGSSSSLSSGGHSLCDNGPPTQPIPEELKTHMPCGSSHYRNGLLLNYQLPNLPVGRIGNENLNDELYLSRNISRMCISDLHHNISADPNGVRLVDHSNCGINQISLEENGSFEFFRRDFSDCRGPQSSVRTSPSCFDGEISLALSGLQCEYRPENLIALQYPSSRADGLVPRTISPCSSQCHRTEEQANSYYQRTHGASNLASSKTQPLVADAFFYAQQNGMDFNDNTGALNLLTMQQITHQWPYLRVGNALHCSPPMLDERTRMPLNFRIPQGALHALTSEDSLIIQGNGLDCLMNNELRHPRGHNCKGSLHDIGTEKTQEKISEIDGHPQFAGICENGHSGRPCCSFNLPPKCHSLVEARGCIYLISKDQHGCRFLQRMFDEGTPQDVQIIFNEIIDHVVELMVNPFGNYLIQKLLEVCNEEQRGQILLVITKEPGQLVRISLNTHGTRAVQKLIETLKTRQQISLVISALEPGFLALIKDLNGNHVVQRCLQCLSNEDNKFIFVAAAKYCVDIATHQHGCCVLQRCISHSTEEHRDNLIAEISANGLLLAQDAYGNYVVQFILELKIPFATSKLISQFQGNYVHLSTQKFSSHVVEKCLVVFNDEMRSKILRELLSASHFEQLLQDPHANYVVQTALRVSEGSLHNLLVDAIECHKANSRNSPYSKRIFSQKLLKK